jgi:hypothetical protein
MAAPIALAGCGGKKAAQRCRADQMYTGNYARACWDAARALCPDRAFWISAKHGLLRPADEIDPYDLPMRRDHPTVTAATVIAQAGELGVLDAPVIVLAGREYANLAYQVWAEVEHPLEGLFIGQQLHELAGMAARGRLPEPF